MNQYLRGMFIALCYLVPATANVAHVIGKMLLNNMLLNKAYNLSQHRYVHSRKGYFLLAAIFVLMYSTMLRAQDEQSGKKLRVLIDDGLIDRSIGNVDKSVTSSAYSIVDADRLRNGLVSLPEVLAQEVGVQTRSTGGEGSLTTVVLRGASSEQVIIYLDGVPLNDASGGPVDLSFIPVDSIDHIEIYRGSTPLELGSPSIGGAVNIVTRKSSLKSSDLSTQAFNSDTNVSASIASFQTYKFSGTSSLAFEKDEILLSASYLQSENNFSFVNDNGTQFNPADDRVEKRQNDGVKQLALLGNWKHRISDRYDTEIRLDILNREKEIPSVSNNADVQTLLDTRQYNFLGQVNIHGALQDNIDVNIKLFATEKNEVFDDSLAQIGFFNQHTESVSSRIGSQLYAQINQQKTQWKLLTAVSRETYETESLQALFESGENTRNRIEVSAENVAYLNQQQLILNAILRYQAIFDEIAATANTFGQVTPAFENTYTFFNPQLGAKYRFNKRTFVATNIGVYNRAPSFFELFGGEGLLLGNPDLKQETSLNTDLGLTYTWFKPNNWLHNTELYTGLFYNRIEDLIVRIFNGQGVGVPANISDAVIRGFEATLKITPSRHHSIHANLSLIDSVNKSSVKSFNGRVLPGYYQTSLGLRYTFSLNRWAYSTEVDIKRDMFYDRSNLLKGDDVNLLNLAVRRDFKSSSIDFRVNNILDENIRYLRNRPTPGLNLSLTYNHSF